ncbi:MAG TPA: MFS transporter [Fervidobacterium sp.]|mgnify:FL=1|jgi:DHA3 family macrolide efflux protein-like MFS transporter|nr:MFS transporter [Fervidobacterium sp.]HUM43164.1 MFS transporter [Fervidobacterium sp.]
MNALNNKWKGKALLFLISQCITLFGSALVQMAVVWYVTVHTSSGAWVAAFTICAYMPQFLFSSVSGVWADRYNRKLLIIAADAGIAVTTLAMWIAMPYITHEPVLLSALLTMSLIRSLGAGIQSPAVSAVIPQIVPADQLMRYNGINATMQSVVQFTAPAAAGAILAVASMRSALFVDVATAMAGIGLLACVAVPTHQVSSGKKSLFNDMKVGIRYSFMDKLLRKLLIVFGLFIFLSVPGPFLAKLYVSRTYGEAYWYLTAIEVIGFVGMALGGVLISTWGGFKNRERTLLTGIFLFGFLEIVMGLSKSFIFYLLIMLLYGIAVTMTQTATTTIIQEQAETSMQGRVFGLFGSLYSGVMPIGMAVFGPLADRIALQLILIGSGGALVLAAGILSFFCRNERHGVK